MSRHAVDEWMERCKEKTEHIVLALVNAELQYPLTLDPTIAAAKIAIFESTMAKYTKITDPNSLTAVTPPSSPFPIEDVIELMAHVTAYFTIASRRFIDYVSKIIDSKLVIEFADQIHHELLEKLFDEHEYSEESLRDLVSEAPEVEKERSELESKEVRLKEVLSRIAEFRL